MESRDKALHPVPINETFAPGSDFDVDEKIYQLQLALATVNLQLAQFENNLFIASTSQSKEGEEAEYWLERFRKVFNN